MKKFFRIALWVLVALVFVGTFYFLWRNSQTPEDSYATVRPTLQTIERTTVLTGKIEPRDEIEIKPRFPASYRKFSSRPGSRSTPAI